MNCLNKYPHATVLLCFFTGLIVWYVPFQVAALLAIVCLLPSAFNWRGLLAHKKLLLGYALFLLFWGTSKFLLALFNGADYFVAIMAGLDLTLRLLTIAGVGLALILHFTPYGLATAAGQLLAKLAPKQAWKFSLAILIMLSFIQEAALAFSGLKQTLLLRGQHLTAPQRITILGSGIINILARQTWDRALAIAARKLDLPSAWK